MANIQLFGIPVHQGAQPVGVKLGPEALRSFQILETLEHLGHQAVDHGNLNDPQYELTQGFWRKAAAAQSTNPLGRWVSKIQALGAQVLPDAVPIFAGGDHSIAAGTLPLMQKRADDAGKPLFVFWLDAHPDFHTPQTSTSGNMHGTPMAYATGEPGFDAHFPPLSHRVLPENVMMIGLRSVDPEERRRLAGRNFNLCDMRRIDEEGIVRPLEAFLRRAKNQNAMVHVSLDVDVLDPSIAPGCGTPVPGGMSLREAHLIMELLYEGGCVTSLDIVELNPLFDRQGQSARTVIELTASLFGRQILET